MKFQELLNEGSFLIKNKSGDQKRFKKDDSPEAKAWAASESPKQAEKHTQAWWDAKHSKASFGDEAVYPWDPIDRYDDLDEAVVRKLIKSTMVDEKSVDHWNFGRPSHVKRGGVECASMQIHLFMSYDKEDDIGNEETVEDGHTLVAARDPANPKKITLVH